MNKKNLLKNILLIVSGMILGVLLIIFLIFSIISGFSKSQVSLKNNSWLVLDYNGLISEKPVSNFPTFLPIASKNVELYNMLTAIEYAGKDPKIKGILIEADMTLYSKVHIEEITLALNNFKKSGKKVIAWFSAGYNNNYFLCLAADKIYMPDTNSATLTLTGYSLTIPYFKKAFDKIGVEFNVVHMGKFKGTGENYVQNTMSDELKESYSSLLDSIYNQKLKDLNITRKIDPYKLKSLLNSGENIFLTPNKAKKYGFIDDMISYDELTESLKINNKFNRISITDYIPLVKNLIKNKNNKIAILYVDGTIVDGLSSRSSLNGDLVGSKTIISEIKQIKKNKNIKALLLRVNSPGGSALASEMILEALNNLKKTIPVYVSLGPIAASGGYFISCSGDKIFTMPSTITGSIGVVSITLNYKDLTDKLGINFETIKKHPFDDFLSPNKKSDINELNILSDNMQKIYSEFLSHVSKSRNINKTDLSKIAEGRVWAGNQSVNIKLSDEIKGLLDSIDYISKTNKIENYSIESYPKAPGLFSLLQDSMQEKLSYQLPYERSNFFKLFYNLYVLYNEAHNNPVMYVPFNELP